MLKNKYIDITLCLILLIGLGLRLHKLNAPILDGDSFRQGATASIARNFYEGGFNLFNPRITGWGNINEAGLWPNEFPLYPYVVACLYVPLGEHVWIPRLLTILFCLAGAAALYDLVRRYDGALTARFAALWYLITPQAIYHGRCFHRHPIAIGLLLIALAVYARWLENRRRSAYIGMTVCGSLALLMMPPLAIIVVPALWMHKHETGKQAWGNGMLWLCGAIMIVPSLLWYGWAIQQPQSYSLNSLGRETFRNWTDPSYYMLWWKHDFFRSVWRSLWFYTLGPLGLVLGTLGIFLKRGSLPRLLIVWVGIIVLYYLIDVHPIIIAPHLVYFLIILAPLSWGAGRATALLWESMPEKSVIPIIPMRGLLCAVILVSSIFYWNNMIQPWYRLKHNWLQAAEIIQDNTPADAKLIVDEFDPSLIHYTHRMGITKNTPDITLESVKLLESEGATHLAIVNQEAFFKKDALRFHLKDTARNVVINQFVRLYELGAKHEETKTE
jgi:4-amino-4-deoxy-L-arabinose transferase-like glycosyltransferase